MQQIIQIGDRMADESSQPDERSVLDWMGGEAFKDWVELRSWIDTSYPGVFAPDWKYGGKKRGWSLRYKKTKAFCTLIPSRKLLSVLVVFGRAEREKFEERRYSWSPRLVELYDAARAYPDGKWLTIPISSADDQYEVMELLRIKRPALCRRSA
ncbi:hypothetical protein AWB82_06798 [Caballeronia glebae]|uniref:DUF3788 domain-containing protein n=1 Tax=Caballeronia glebae TaxID=1777143 RepID=A0A158DIC7_9BURK|nr:DUF3788 domain-containing protein [Caballeronia glebae]SAK94369.1 hypothetical protein AWB82_06798 [Caballeronia glebae]